VRRVTDIMGEISAASEEQSGGIEQVNRAVTQMDTVTQQNAALVEEAAAAAASLEEQTRNLQNVLATWRTNGGSHGGNDSRAVRPTAVSSAPAVSASATPAVKSAAPKAAAPKPAAASASAARRAPLAKPASDTAATAKPLAKPAARTEPQIASTASSASDDSDWETF
jgi:methyl-accepting chemotaxis protein I, serine sensor receptor